MARNGAFHPELFALAWFDPTLFTEAWFDTDLIPATGAALTVAVFDDDVVAEVVAVTVNPLTVNVFDDDAPAEGVLVLTGQVVVVQVADAVGASEAIAVAIPMAVGVADEAVPADAVMLALPLAVTVVDDDLPADVAVAAIPMGVGVFDDDPAAEVGTILRNPLLGVASDEVVPGEVVVLALSGGGGLAAIAFDTLTIRERRSVLAAGFEEALFRDGAILTTTVTGELVLVGSTDDEEIVE